jgi:uncharacterized protein (DUF983 family)
VEKTGTIMLKGTKLYSILFNKCPRCHGGDFFVTKTAYDFKSFDKMHKRCSHCDEDFEREPGFYFGAMYTSYGLYVATIVTSFVGFVVLLGGDELRLLAFLIPALILLMPLYFRIGRRIWINIFVKYKSTKVKESIN